MSSFFLKAETDLDKIQHILNSMQRDDGKYKKYRKTFGFKMIIHSLQQYKNITSPSVLDKLKIKETIDMLKCVDKGNYNFVMFKDNEEMKTVHSSVLRRIAQLITKEYDIRKGKMIEDRDRHENLILQEIAKCKELTSEVNNLGGKNNEIIKKYFDDFYALYRRSNALLLKIFSDNLQGRVPANIKEQLKDRNVFWQQQKKAKPIEEFLEEARSQAAKDDHTPIPTTLSPEELIMEIKCIMRTIQETEEYQPYNSFGFTLLKSALNESIENQTKIVNRDGEYISLARRVVNWFHDDNEHSESFMMYRENAEMVHAHATALERIKQSLIKEYDIKKMTRPDAADDDEVLQAITTCERLISVVSTLNHESDVHEIATYTDDLHAFNLHCLKVLYTLVSNNLRSVESNGSTKPKLESKTDLALHELQNNRDVFWQTREGPTKNIEAMIEEAHDEEQRLKRLDEDNDKQLLQKCSYDGCPGGGGDLKQCSGCKSVQYCGKACQTNHWKQVHRLTCKKELREKKDHADVVKDLIVDGGGKQKKRTPCGRMGTKRKQKGARRTRLARTRTNGRKRARPSGDWLVISGSSWLSPKRPCLRCHRG